jgi:hypothetical protein
MLDKIARGIGGAALVLGRKAVRAVCTGFIVLVILGNMPRFLAAETMFVKAQVLAGVVLFSSLAYWIGFDLLS